MSRLTLDKLTASLADNAHEIMDVCDPSGRILGHFLPLATPEDYAALNIEITDTELERREKTERGRPLKAIFADLTKRK